MNILISLSFLAFSWLLLTAKCCELRWHSGGSHLLQRGWGLYQFSYRGRLVLFLAFSWLDWQDSLRDDRKWGGWHSASDRKLDSNPGSLQWGQKTRTFIKWECSLSVFHKAPLKRSTCRMFSTLLTHTQSFNNRQLKKKPIKCSQFFIVSSWTKKWACFWLIREHPVH